LLLSNLILNFRDSDLKLHLHTFVFYTIVVFIAAVAIDVALAALFFFTDDPVEATADVCCGCGRVFQCSIQPLFLLFLLLPLMCSTVVASIPVLFNCNLLLQ